MTLRILRQPGSPTMWFVEGRSVRCNKCSRTYPRDATKRRAPGYACPKCGDGELEEVWHSVDESSLLPIGECDCMDFQTRKRPLLKDTTEKQRFSLSYEQQEELRCTHIKCARNQSHNDTLKGHVGEKS